MLVSTMLLLLVKVVEGGGADDRALRQAHQPLPAVGIMADLPQGIVRHNVYDQVRRAVVDELVRLPGPEYEGVPGRLPSFLPCPERLRCPRSPGRTPTGRCGSGRGTRLSPAECGRSPRRRDGAWKGRSNRGRGPALWICSCRRWRTCPSARPSAPRERP